MKKTLALLMTLCLMSLIPAAGADTAQGVLKQKIATRTGPGTNYTEPGTYLRAGSRVTVHTKVWDSVNEIWWVQVEFSNGSQNLRAYTGAQRMNVDLTRVPSESSLRSCRTVRTCWSYAGPGTDYVCWSDMVPRGTSGTLWEVENGYGLIDCWDSNSYNTRERVWIDLDDLDIGYLYDRWDDTYPNYGGSYDEPDYGQAACTITGGSVNCRVAVGTDNRTVTYVHRGERYFIYGYDWDDEGTLWYKIYVKNQYLWISSEWADRDDEDNRDLWFDGSSPDGQMCTIADRYVSCRSGAGYENNAVHTLYQDDRCLIHEVKKGSDGQDWYKIYANSRYVWIPSSCTAFGTTYTADNGAGEFVGRYCVILAESGNARSGPGVQYGVVNYVREGEWYYIYDTAVASNGRTWYKISINEAWAWVSSGIASVDGALY